MASGSCRSGRRRVEPPPHGLMVLVALAVVLGGALAYNTPAAGEAVSQHAMMKGGCLKYVAQVQGPVGRSAAGGGSGADGGRQQRELSATVGLGGNGTATSNDTTNATTSQYAAAGAKGTVDETIIDDATGLSRLSFRLRNVPASKDGVVHVVDLDLGALLQTAPGGHKQQAEQRNDKEQVHALSQEEPGSPSGNTTTLQMVLPDGNTVALTVTKVTGAQAAASSSKLLCAKPLSGQGQELCLDDPQKQPQHQHQQQEVIKGGAGDVGEGCETWAGQSVNGTDGSSGVFTRCGSTWSAAVFGPDYRMWVIAPVSEDGEGAANAGAAGAGARAGSAAAAATEGDGDSAKASLLRASRYVLFEAVDVEGDDDRLQVRPSTVPAARTPSPGGLLGGRRALQQQQQGGSCNTDEGNYAYINVYYTEDVSLTRADVETQVAVTNQALLRARAGFQLVLLRFEKVHSSWHKNGDMDAALENLQDPDRRWYSPPDSMAGSAADLVLLVVPRGEYGGVAWVGQRSSVVHADSFRSLTFAHELGHNFGGYHNREEYPPNLHPYAFAPWVVAGSPPGPTEGAMSILSYNEPCKSRNGGRYCPRAPQYGHNGDNITVTVNGQSRVLAFGNAANDLGRAFRERKADTVNFGVHTCDRFWADQQLEGYASTKCVQPLSMADCNIACSQDASCMGVDWYQGSRVCCKVYGSASGGLRFKAAPATPGSWGRVFTKRRGNITDNRPPGGLACAPSKGAATQAWSHTNSSCVASAGASTATYAIRTSTAANMCVDVPSSLTATNGAALRQWSCSGTSSQGFVLVPSGDLNYYYIRTTGGKCWDVSVPGDGAPVTLWSCSGRDTQKFALVPSGTGYTLRPKHAGLAACVTVSSGSTANGAKIQMWWCNNTAAQRFTLV